MLDRFEVEGLDDLERQLTALGGKDGLTALRRSARAAMKPVKDQMEATAPFDEKKTQAPGADADKHELKARAEHMRDDIKMTSRRQDKKGGHNNALSVRVGPHRAHTQKAAAAEYGTIKQDAEPFMRPSLYDNRHQVVHIMKDRLAAEIARITDKNRRA